MTPTKTPRERFDESFPSLNFSSVEGLKNEDSIARSAIWSFFETLLEEARQDGEARGVQKGREEMKKECLKAVDKWDGGYPSNHSTGPKFCFTPEIKQAISSL